MLVYILTLAVLFFLTFFFFGKAIIIHNNITDKNFFVDVYDNITFNASKENEKINTYLVLASGCLTTFLFFLSAPALAIIINNILTYLGL